MGYTGGSTDKRSSTSSGGNGKSRPRSNGGGGGGGRRRDYDGEETSDEEAGGGDGDGALDCDESLDAAATDDEVRRCCRPAVQRHAALHTVAETRCHSACAEDVRSYLLACAVSFAARCRCDA